MSDISSIGGAQNAVVKDKVVLEQRKQQEEQKTVEKLQKGDEVTLSDQALSLSRAADTARDTRVALERQKEQTLAADKSRVDQLA